MTGKSIQVHETGLEPMGVNDNKASVGRDYRRSLTFVPKSMYPVSLEKEYKTAAKT